MTQGRVLFLIFHMSFSSWLSEKSLWANILSRRPAVTISVINLWDEQASEVHTPDTKFPLDPARVIEVWFDPARDHGSGPTLARTQLANEWSSHWLLLTDSPLAWTCKLNAKLGILGGTTRGNHNEISNFTLPSQPCHSRYSEQVGDFVTTAAFAISSGHWCKTDPTINSHSL